jgi:hypothetical protein
VSRRALGVLAATLASVGLATLFFHAGYPSPIYDGWGYYRLAALLREQGLAGWPTGIRTYGYPLFALFATGFRPIGPEGFSLVLFVAQLAVYLAVCALVARRLARILGSPRLGAAAFALGALNPALLLQATEPLTDLLSAALILAAVALAWRLPDAARPAAPAAPLALASILCAGFAVAVRPANVGALAGLAAAWALRTWRWREPAGRLLLAAAIGVLAPLVPQAIARHAQTGAYLPLVEPALYRDQAAWGMRVLKYGTLVVDGRPPFLLSTNPLDRGASTPGEFAAQHPFAYAGTLFLHGFALLDRDLPFTYVTRVDAWYRVPVAFANLLLIGLALAGLVAAGARLARRKTLDEPAFAVLSIVLVGGAYLALYLPVAVESRFGAPLQALAPALAVAGLASLRDSPAARTRRAALALALSAVTACGGLALSAWIARHRMNPPDLSALSASGVRRPESPAPRPGTGTATPVPPGR